MNQSALSASARSSLWSRVWHFLRTIDEAVHTTDLDVLWVRVGRLEQELKRQEDRLSALLESVRGCHR